MIGRGLRRANYAIDPETGKFAEEVAKIFGVPFEVIPFKANAGRPSPKEKRHHVYAVPGKEAYRIEFPRVEGYTQAIKNRINMDWEKEPVFCPDPINKKLWVCNSPQLSSGIWR